MPFSVCNDVCASIGVQGINIKVWIVNEGIIPYPTAMGKRNGRIRPIIASISGKGIKILEGKKRTLVKNIV